MPRCRLGLTCLLVTTLGTLTSAQAPRPATVVGVRGYVVTHEDAPVSSGAVLLEESGRPSAINASLDRDGRFRAVVSTSGLHRLTITVPGFAPHRVNVIVPPSRSIALPAIRLMAPTYFRARFLNAAGDPILSPRLRVRFQNGDRMTMSASEDHGAARLDGEGGITLGPLARGLHTPFVDMPAMALTALKPVAVTGEESMLDAGTIAILPGTVLHVDLVDGSGAPVTNHLVTIHDVAPDSPLSFPEARTDQHGRATFDRLAAGRYRVRTTAIDPCHRLRFMSASRLVAVNGTGEVHQRIELDGMVRLVVTSPFGPLAGASVSVTPDGGDQPVATQRFVPGRPFPVMTSGCAGMTDEDGRVSFTHVPPGPIRIEVRSGNSTHQRRANARSRGPELAIAIPAGFVQLHVTNELTGGPVVNASVTWNGNGARVQSTTNGTGAVLLEGIGDGEGLFEATANGFAADSATVTVSPTGTHHMTLRPNPPPGRRVRVVGPAAEPVPGAIVELLPPTVLDIGVIAATDAKGEVVFPDAPPVGLSATASAEGFAKARFSVAANVYAPVVVTLAPLR